MSGRLGCAGQREETEGHTRVLLAHRCTCGHAQRYSTATSLRASSQDIATGRYHPPPVSVAASGLLTGGRPSDTHEMSSAPHTLHPASHIPTAPECRRLLGPSWSNRARLTEDMLSSIMELPGTRGMYDLRTRADALSAWKLALQRG